MDIINDNQLQLTKLYWSLHLCLLFIILFILHMYHTFSLAFKISFNAYLCWVFESKQI